VTRYTDQGRDLSEPLVPIGESASLIQRIGAWFFRSYLLLGALVALLAGIFTLAWVLLGSD